MPIGTRIRANNAYGATTDTPLTAPATSFNSTQLQLLPAVVSPSQHAVITLDPKRVFGEPEIVVVTAHTGLSSTATITRGAYGTTARSHPVGTAWVHLEVDEDYTEILSSTTRPSDPYVGQYIYEIDTLSLRHYNGSTWTSAPSIGALIPFLGSSAPTGYLFANGSAVSRTGVTANLFAIIGTSYGVGDGLTTFNLPNLAGRLPVGRNVSEAEFDVLGEVGGEKTVILDGSKMPQHLHDIQIFLHRHGEFNHDHSFVNLPFVGANGNHGHSGSIGGDGGHDHQTVGPGFPAMVVSTGAGPFNVSPPGTDFVTFDVGPVGRTSAVGNHGHSTGVTNSGNLMQAVKSNHLPAATNISVDKSPPDPNPTPNPSHNNIQRYITVNYLIKI